MEHGARVFVAGHDGLLGRALVRRLREEGYAKLLLASRAELDLTRQSEVEAFFSRTRPEYVFLAAARVGGIQANQETPADLIAANLAIETHVVRAAHEVGVQGLCLFGSSCMYPRDGRQPMPESDLGAGPLEPTSQAYAVAKIAGVELCRAYRAQFSRRFFSMVPATLYGPHDHFDTERAHVIPALLSRFHAAQRTGATSVTVLGTGRPLREFLHVDDAAEAALFLMRSGADLDVVNVGSGEELTVGDLAQRIAQVVGYTGGIHFNPDAADGAPRKLLDSSRARALGWKPRVPLDVGLEHAYRWYRTSGTSSSDG